MVHSLIISSQTDPVARAGMTAQAVGQLCQQGDRAQFFNYQDADFGGVTGDSVREQITWIQAASPVAPPPATVGELFAAISESSHIERGWRRPHRSPAWARKRTAGAQ